MGFGESEGQCAERQKKEMLGEKLTRQEIID